MNTSSPLIPQGSLQGKPRGKANFRIAVFTILAIHVVLLSGLLMQGCKKEETPGSSGKTNAAVIPAFPPLTNEPIVSTLTNTLPPETNLIGLAAPPASHVEPTPWPQPPALSAATHEYTVVRGDTLGKIAKAQGTSVKAIEAANPGIKPTKLKPGEKIQVPAPAAGPGSALSASAAATPGAATTGDQPAAAAVYTVKPGDNLTKIASKHGVSVKSLRTANNLKTDQIRVGQKLKIPATAAAQNKTIAPVASSTAASGLATP